MADQKEEPLPTVNGWYWCNMAAAADEARYWRSGCNVHPDRMAQWVRELKEALGL